MTGLEKAVERLHDKAVAVPGYTVLSMSPAIILMEVERLFMAIRLQPQRCL